MDEQEIRAEIMVVDDSRGTLQLLNRMLNKSGYDVRPMGDGQSALESAYQKPPDLAVLDISMAGLNGYELCSALKRSPGTQNIPVIFVSALDDVRNKSKAFKVGAIDYIVKPFEFQEVLIRIEAHLKMARQMQALKEMAGAVHSQQYNEVERFDQNLEFIAHDLRNPLHVISLNLSLLKKQLDLDSEQLTGYFERIERNLSLVKHIINQSLAVGK